MSVKSLLHLSVASVKSSTAEMSSYCSNLMEDLNWTDVGTGNDASGVYVFSSFTTVREAFIATGTYHELINRAIGSGI